ncbi:hypothetical protein D5S17_26325 [Pseudonocardiaceae bacterium YIM PH 21723]|nr:hypothetical protein D5S17_26325 [Pseudonocardiaceae bacterium YIM PH 21723]
MIKFFRLVTVLVALVVTGTFAVPVPPAQAGACTTADGVTVVVDFQGSRTVACAPGSPGSGLAALQGAGFSYVFPSKQPGFVCRINGNPASDPCVNTPPATAYWSYWHAQPGGSWVYSDLGAGNYRPPAGSVEGWSFGSGSQPGIAPPARPALPQQPGPAPGQPAPGQPAPNQPAPGQPAPEQPGQPGQTTTTAPSSTSASSSAPASSESSSAATTDNSPSTSAGTQPAAQQSGSSWWGVVLGILVIVVLAGAAFVIVRKRRKAEE